MSAERMPQEEPSLLAKPMAALTAWAVRYPVRTLAVAAVLALLCTGLSARFLRLHTARSDLINPQSQYHRYWLDYTQEFTDQEDVVIVVEGETAQQVTMVTEEVIAALEKHPQYFTSILHRIDFSPLRAKGLYYLRPEQLEKIEKRLQEAERRLANFQQIGDISQSGSTPRLSVPGGKVALASDPKGFLGSSSGRVLLPPPVRSSQPGRFFPSKTSPPQQGLGGDAGGESALGAVGSVLEDLSPDGAVLQWTSDGLTSPDGRMAFVLLRLVKEGEEKFARYSEQIDTLRRMTAHLRQRHPGVSIGLTGLPIIENDEMRASEISSARSSILALVGVMVVFVMGFGGLRHPLLANAALMCGMIWASGFTTLSIGRLNILSIAFAAILIGQGADFGIYYIARYLQLRKTTQLPPAESLIETGRTAGPSIADGALGTAAAFFMAGLTDFQGVAELGVIAGGGLILCWLATMLVLPAMVRLVDGSRLFRRLPEPLDLLPWFRPLYFSPRLTLTATLVLTVVLSVGMSRLWYDHNLFHLLPTGLESAELERKLVAQSDKAVYYALSIADSRQEVQERKKRFLSLPSVQRVEEIASVLADEAGKKQPIILRIRQSVEKLSAQLSQMERFLAGGEKAASASRLASLGRASGSQGMIPSMEAYLAQLREGLEKLAAAAHPDPPRLEDLPRGLTDRFVGRHGRHLMKVYSKADIWDLEGMTQFVQEIRSVDPRATGNPVQIYEASRQMKQSFLQAAFYASLVIVPLLLFDFRNLLHTFWALLPLVLGMVQMFGLMGWLNIPFNPANMIVLPIILGIGIDNGVHIVHDFLQQGRGYRRMSSSTCMAIVINSLCNMVGFGSLMIASHQGLQSLGRVLTIGMACILANSLVLPNLLVLYQRRQTGEDSTGKETPVLAAIPDVSEGATAAPVPPQRQAA